MIWFFSILGVLGYVTFFATVGGLGDFISKLAKHNASSAGKFYLLWVAKLFPIANLLWFMPRAARGQRSGRFAVIQRLTPGRCTDKERGSALEQAMSAERSNCRSGRTGGQGG